MTILEKIRQANDAARASWGAYNEDQLRMLLEVFEGSSYKIKALLLEASIKGAVPYARTQFLNVQIEKELTVLYQYLNTFIEKGSIEAINQALEGSIRTLYPIVGDRAQIGTSFIDKAGVVRHWAPQTELYSASMWAALNTQALDHFMRFRPQGLILSKEIWNVTWEGQRQVLRRIGEAIVLGEKVSTLATSIEALIGVSPAQKLDAFTDKLILPGRGVYKSMYANATRLARTELSRAYVEGQHRYNTTKDWITGVIHRIGGANPCEACQDLAGTFYPKGEYTEIPVHPHCECYEEPVLSDEWNS